MPKPSRLTDTQPLQADGCRRRHEDCQIKEADCDITPANERPGKHEARLVRECLDQKALPLVTLTSVLVWRIRRFPKEVVCLEARQSVLFSNRATDG